jgi:hypothetical protein
MPHQMQYRDLKIVTLEGQLCVMRQYKSDMQIHSDSMTYTLQPGDWIQFFDPSKSATTQVSSFVQEIWFLLHSATDKYTPDIHRFYLLLQDHDSIQCYYKRLDSIINTVVVLPKKIPATPAAASEASDGPADIIMTDPILSENQIADLLKAECEATIIVPFIGLLLTFPWDFLSQICVQGKINKHQQVLKMTTELHQIMDPIIASGNIDIFPHFYCKGLPIYDPYEFLVYQCLQIFVPLSNDAAK